MGKWKDFTDDSVQQLLMEYWAKKMEVETLQEVNVELVKALRLMNIECQHLHHAKKDQHGHDVACPVVDRIKISIAKATGEQQ